jgi:hypothetical protein
MSIDELLTWLKDEQRKVKDKSTSLLVQNKDLIRLQVQSSTMQRIINKIEGAPDGN